VVGDSRAINFLACVLFPDPSIPSKLIIMRLLVPSHTFTVMLHDNRHFIRYCTVDKQGSVA
jgi:hypothetical protein